MDHSNQEINKKKNSNASNQNHNDKTKTTQQMILSLFEINVIRYSLFMENLKPEYIDPFFMIDFMSLPEDYFVGNAYKKYGLLKIKNNQNLFYY